MKPAPFTYHRPGSPEEVDELLAEFGGRAKILNGGQSLIPLMNMRLLSPEHVIDLCALPDTFAQATRVADHVHIGAVARQRTVEHSTVVAEGAPLLAEVMRHVAHPAIRSRGTVAGAVAHADPASELPATVLALDAEMVARSVRGERVIPAADFFVGPLESALLPDEWLCEIRIPHQHGNGAIEEFSRRRGDYALCGVVVVAGSASVRIVFFGVPDAPMLLSLERAVASSDGYADAVAMHVESRLDLHDDIHATSAYRAHLARALGARAVARALAAGRNGG